MHIPEGTVIDGRFRIGKMLGAGGMGAVFEAEQMDLARTVAIKFLTDPMMAESEAAARFQQEAQLLSQLRHKNIVGVYAFGQWQHCAYMSMERVYGTSLQEKLQSNQPLDDKFVLDVAREVCSGLQAAHAMGIVHRDLKPSNLIVSDSGDVKIIDFGLAKILNPGAMNRQQLTEAGATVGSVLYMSPEQCLGAPVDTRSDIYALGCVLHHCLTGVPPFTGDHSVVVMMQHTEEPLPRLRGNLENWQRVLDMATVKDPAQRYQSVGEMLMDLDLIAKGENVAAKAIVLPLPKVRAARSKIPLIAAMLGAMVVVGIFFATALSPPAADERMDPLKVAALQKQIDDSLQELSEAPMEKWQQLDIRIAELNLSMAKLNRRQGPHCMREANRYAAAALGEAHEEQYLDLIERLSPCLFSSEQGKSVQNVCGPVLSHARELVEKGHSREGHDLLKRVMKILRLDSSHETTSQLAYDGMRSLLVSDMLLGRTAEAMSDLNEEMEFVFWHHLDGNAIAELFNVPINSSISSGNKAAAQDFYNRYLQYCKSSADAKLVSRSAFDGVEWKMPHSAEYASQTMNWLQALNTDDARRGLAALQIQHCLKLCGERNYKLAWDTMPDTSKLNSPDLNLREYNLRGALQMVFGDTPRAKEYSNRGLAVIQKNPDATLQTERFSAALLAARVSHAEHDQEAVRKYLARAEELKKYVPLPIEHVDKVLSEYRRDLGADAHI
jgi:tRNA A-37 threonylcarbamoyl transferase component Bud32